ncbi:MAG: ABC transporter permease [Bacteroidota bacterium]|jgi:lipopolysaccharide transport system permease protein
MQNKDDNWTLIIRPKNKWYEINLKEIWTYRDLILLFVKRDFVSQYKQTVLGPLWMFIQPLLHVLLFSIIFGVIANIPTQGAPRLLFYLAAFVPWTYFSDCFLKNSTTFLSNASIFGKVYFPRLVRPISITISNLYKFGVQLILFFIIYFIFVFKGYSGKPDLKILFFPVLIIFPAVYGLSMGLIVSALTIKYRDLNFITSILIQALMYGSSIVYSITDMPAKLSSYLKWNPFVWIMEAFRYALIGVGTWSWGGLIYSMCVMLLLLIIAIIVFNKTEKNFIDVI